MPKQFHDLDGRSVLEVAVAALSGRPAVRGVVVVLPEEFCGGAWGARARGWRGVTDVVPGGASRARSVLAGMAAAGGAEFVLVHDAARPLAAPELVDAVVAATRLHGAAVPVIEVPDTVKRACGEWVEGGPAREGLRLAQTPQGFRAGLLRAALERGLALGDEPTDEAAAVARGGARVAAVPGDPGNFKITEPGDLVRARRIAEGGGADLRVGTGFDIHAVDPSRKLVLGGVPFPGEPGLSGHSDADVVLHAAMDALLGAAGLGDIGTWFPPSDARWAGADSRVLARRVADEVRAAGYDVLNLDLTLLAEWPRIGERAGDLRAAIADSFDLAPSRVGLKATTLEGLGALGRREGLACQATCLLRGRGRT